MTEVFPGLIQKAQNNKTILVVQVAFHIMIYKVNPVSAFYACCQTSFEAIKSSQH